MTNPFEKHFDFAALRRAAAGDPEEIRKAEEEKRELDLRESPDLADLEGHETAQPFKKISKPAKPRRSKTPRESWVAEHEKRQDDYGKKFAGQLGPDA
jgi:hypothetical protein